MQYPKEFMMTLLANIYRVLCSLFAFFNFHVECMYDLQHHIMHRLVDNCFSTFSKTLSQTDISSRKFQYGQYAICIVALFSGQPVLTVVVAVVLGPSHAVSVWVCSIFSSEIDWHSV